MSTRSDSHEQLEELIAAASLDGLDDADLGRLERELAAHGPDCAECRELRAQHAEAAASLAVALEPVPMSAGAEERLIAAVHATGDGARVRPAPAGAHRPEQAGRPAVPRLRRWLAVAAAIVVAAGGGYLLRDEAADPPAAFVAFVADARTSVIHFPARGEEQLALYYRPGEQSAWLAGSNLSDPDGGVYQLWYQPPGTSTMESAGTFIPSGGTVTEPVAVGTAFDAVAVSVEPQENPQPTGPVVFIAEAAPVS